MWELTHPHARLTLDGLSAVVIIDRPDLGVREIAAWKQLQSHAVLRLSTGPEAETVSDCFVRGTDLVTSYGTTARRSVCPQVYWRALAPADQPGIRGLELILSVQTDRLDSEAMLTVSSQLPAGEVWQMVDDSPRFERLAVAAGRAAVAGPGCLLFRQPTGPSYAEMIFPSDFSSANIDFSDGVNTTWRLFPEHLEKGVIRRGRLRGVFLTRDRDLELAARCYQDFLASPLPLTT